MNELKNHPSYLLALAVIASYFLQNAPTDPILVILGSGTLAFTVGLVRHAPWLRVFADAALGVAGIVAWLAQEVFRNPSTVGWYVALFVVVLIAFNIGTGIAPTATRFIPLPIAWILVAIAALLVLQTLGGGFLRP